MVSNLKNKIWGCLVVKFVIIFASTNAVAHPGALDRFGGHWDHKRNVYICHLAKCTPPQCSNNYDYRCDNQYYGKGNYAPGGRNNTAR
jgi:hypothetical protein